MYKNINFSSIISIGRRRKICIVRVYVTANNRYKTPLTRLLEDVCIQCC